ncbi:MAG: M23 family metallopeptidase, partial [Ferruginibacter sp.]
MRTFFLFSFLSFIFPGCYSSNNPLSKQVRLLKDGNVTGDSSYVYALPFAKGKSFRVVQGYFSQFSHRDRAALDFNMKRGTEIYAVRAGIVIRVKEDGERGGLNRKFRKDGNNIVIRHFDGSNAGYWHLQKDGALVSVGDTVKEGQLIALSGQTGYAAFPHLHFLVWKSGPEGWQQVPTRFKTSHGIKYLKFRGKYKNPG